ncbi:hypothetical protein [Actinomadura sp. NPDC049753]|uniref:hypothetical protein n=1 Tax=Actinomadura sp. NPDC049753 TaxID=3154739 RepID=UPI00342E4799
MGRRYRPRWACRAIVRDALADPDPWHGFRGLCELHARSREFAADREQTLPPAPRLQLTNPPITP